MSGQLLFDQSCFVSFLKEHANDYSGLSKALGALPVNVALALGMPRPACLEEWISVMPSALFLVSLKFARC